MKDRPRAGFVPQTRAICEIGSVWQAGEKNNESEDIADYCFARHHHPLNAANHPRKLTSAYRKLSAMAEFAAKGADRAMKYTVRLKTKPRRRWG